MALPDLIEIVPLDKPVRAEITVPGSKSITNRALILAALANGDITLKGALWSEDTQVMVEALQKLGFEVRVEPEPEEFCNRTITVKGLGGKIPKAGTAEKPLEIFVGNAGTAARFLAPFVCLGHGVYRLHGVPRMHERPQRPLFYALWELGYKVEATNDKLPAVIHGTGPHDASCTVSIEESSQFASALLLSGDIGKWKVIIAGDNQEEASYVTMTRKLKETFPKTGGFFEIELDASSGSYFAAANKLAPRREYMEYSPQFGTEVETTELSRISMQGGSASESQIDARFHLALMAGVRSEVHPDDLKETPIPQEFRRMMLFGEISRDRDLGDSIMTAIVLAPFAESKLRFTDLGRLRLQECERVVALRTELTKCGAKVIEEGDTLEVFPSELHGAEIETYNDHRMAMCFAVLGLKVPGMKIRNPACVKKTFPNFFQKFAAPPPHGLGVTILDGRSGRKLGLEELFAD